MPRPRKPRFVQGRPVAGVFEPDRTPPWGRHVVLLPLEGLEAIRLIDHQGLDQATAAEVMNVSRQTFGRILSEARAVVADALVTGKTLRIEGGDYALPSGGGRRRRRRRRGGSE
ncbi:MAG: DUF134 domain-containing protein [Deltaproteobacteria bacterium]|nr:DUF134 domain-containing protein [Deltaproteobacteria bacterium]